MQTVHHHHEHHLLSSESGSCKLLIARSHFLGESRLSLVACSPFDHDLHEERDEDDDEEHDEEHDDEDDDEDHKHDDDGAFFKAF